MTKNQSDIVVIVHRVTLPRYEMQYPRVKIAWEHAQSIKERNTFAVPVDFIEPIGQELVFDLGAKGVPLSVTLLFRIIQKTETYTAFDWWARRSTDRDLFELWLQELEGAVHPEKSAPRTSILPNEMTKLFEMSRRTKSHNLFIALDVHWTVGEQEIRQAYEKCIQSIAYYERIPALSPRARMVLSEARTAIDAAYAKLCILEERHIQRAKYVPSHKLEQARDLWKSKLVIAKLREDNAELRRLKSERAEIFF